ncbi:uncharacterized protein LAJ45_02747 [Morchella importuna]|uniref:glutaminase n=1 Tax=Morchella conica CCBAS932 TaxID=1392247 RepID=A0A3N4KTY6_9PEZI|nr:uncharacterized protein LAJ45_02747 [Morchella importuna]KAH8153160.1 hypothetical protein LAJ45_02747 [Morchella importuna]RPB12742.1 SNO glutamine amidotransferase [Morchella conica CCBAS932]
MTVGQTVTIGVLALQGAFSEHMQLLRGASIGLKTPQPLNFILVKTPAELSQCSALIIPGGESTAMALVAERSGLLEPLREFVKLDRRPTWGTCAGMILLSEAANRTKKGGQALIGGLAVRVNRNHFGRQVESFEAPLRLSFLNEEDAPFNGVFIRAPIVEAILPQDGEEGEDDVEVRAPKKEPRGVVESVLGDEGHVEILAELRRTLLPTEGLSKGDRPLYETHSTDVDMARERENRGSVASIVAVRQGNVVGTSFHPELTSDLRMHRWWLQEVLKDLKRREELVEKVKHGESVQ